jgi:hypothetical protein
VPLPAILYIATPNTGQRDEFPDAAREAYFLDGPNPFLQAAMSAQGMTREAVGKVGYSQCARVHSHVPGIYFQEASPISKLLEGNTEQRNWCRREDSNLHTLTGTTP